MPFVKFEVAVPPTTSRCQAWKFRVCPATAAVGPVGVGIWVRLSSSEKEPVVPVFLIWPAPT